MKYYFREHERAQERIIELEKRRDFLQANVTAIIACWEQVSQSPIMCRSWLK